VSSTVKTNIKQVSNPNRQIKYSFTIYFIESQLANIHIGIKNVVNIIKNKDIPSIPNVMPEVISFSPPPTATGGRRKSFNGTQSHVVIIWKFELLGSKIVKAKIDTQKLSIDVIKAKIFSSPPLLFHFHVPCPARSCE
jgi:hypothetical protein